MNILNYQNRQSVLETRQVIERLRRSLDKEYRWLVNLLAERNSDPERVEVLSKTALKLSQLVASVDELKADVHLLTGRQSVIILQKLSADILHTLQTQPENDYLIRHALIDTLGMVNTAQQQLPTGEHPQAQNQRRVVIHAELLYQAYLELFPAEKMLVGAGRYAHGVTTLNALFDVTGAANAGHVRANPNALARTLIAMDYTDTYLAAWLHSHPGRGFQATQPSMTDLAQHEDWIKNYSPTLVSIIFVEDGWLRFWGSGLENGQVSLEIKGSGIKKEVDYEWIYHIY